jgi:hypothetical protein
VQGLIDQLQEDVKTVRPAVEKTRPNTTKNPDVDRLEEDVNRITKRWGNCCMQASFTFRLSSNGATFKMGLFTFVSGSYQKIELKYCFSEKITCP